MTPIEAEVVVMDAEFEPVALNSQSQADVRAGRVSLHIGQRFLSDPKQNRFHAIGQYRPLPVDFND